MAAPPVVHQLTGETKSADHALRLVALALAALVAIAYARVLFGGQTFAIADHLRFAIPAGAQLAEALRAGRLPEWWEGVHLGVNVAANPMYQSAYPPGWLVGLFGAAYGTDLILVAHLLLGGVGLALWARKLGASPYGCLVGGALFMLCGYTSSIAIWHSTATATAWIPWVAWSADRLHSRATEHWLAGLGATAVAAMPLAMLFMAGDPSAGVSGSIVGLVVAFARAHKRVRALAAEACAISVALLMSAAVLLPAAVNLSETDRGALGNTSLTWSLHPLTLLQLVWPRAFGDPADPTTDFTRLVANASSGDMEPAFARSIHFGVIGIGLVVVGSMARLRGARILAACSLGLLLVAMGSYTPVYALFRFAVLPEHWLRYPARHFAAVVALWSALAAVGFDETMRQASRKRIWLTLLTSLAIATTLAVVVWIGGAPFVSRLKAHTTVAPLGGVSVQASKAARAVLSGGISTITASIGFGIALLVTQRKRFSHWAGAIAAATISVQLVIEAAVLIPVAPRDGILGNAGLLAGARPEAGPEMPRPRLYRDPLGWVPGSPAKMALLVGQSGYEDLGWLRGFSHVPGYSPAFTEARWMKVLLAISKAASLHYAALGDIGPMMTMFDVQYAIVRDQDPPAGFERIRRDKGNKIALFDKKLIRPRAFVTSRWMSLDDDDDVITSLFDPASDLSFVRFVRQSVSPERHDGGEAVLEQCGVTSPRPEHVDLHCTTDTGGYAVLEDAWAPGWTATVDDVAMPVERADEVLRAVRVEAGDHRISFAFSAPGFRAGLWISFVTWLAIAAVVVKATARQKALPSAPSVATPSGNVEVPAKNPNLGTTPFLSGTHAGKKRRRRK